MAETCCSRAGMKVNKECCENCVNYCVYIVCRVALLCIQCVVLCCVWQEREGANTLFKSKKGKELQKEIAKKSKTFVPGAGLPDTAKPSGKFCGTFHALCVVRLQQNVFVHVGYIRCIHAAGWPCSWDRAPWCWLFAQELLWPSCAVQCSSHPCFPITLA